MKKKKSGYVKDILEVKDSISAREAKEVEQKEIGELQRDSIAENALETGEDVLKTLPQAVTLNWSDEILESMGFPELGEKTKVMAQEARERSPIASFATELLAGPPAVGPLKLGRSVLKAAGMGALSGAGIGEGKTEKLIYGTGGGLLGGAGSFLSNIGGKIFSEPTATRARALGTPRSLLGIEGGPKDVKQGIEGLKEIGFLKKGKLDFDISKGKFVKSSKGIQIKQGGANTLRSLKQLSEATEDKIDKEVRNILKTNNSFVTGDDFVADTDLHQSLNELADRLSSVEGADKVMPLIHKELSIVRDAINDMGGRLDIDSHPRYGKGIVGSSLEDLDKIIKSEWQSASDKVLLAEAKSGQPLPADQRVSAQIKRDIAVNLRKFVLKNLPKEQSNRMKYLNQVSSTLKNVRGNAIEKGIAEFEGKQFAMGAPLGANVAYLGSKVLESLGADTEGSLSRAAMGDVIERVPEGARNMMSEGMRRYLPAEGRRLMQNSEGSPALMGLEALLGSTNAKEPQSLPSSLISVKLPRNTQEVLKRPNLLIAKVAQQAPQHYDMLMQAKDDPEAMAQILPIISRDMSALFERDKYNSWDGKVIDPADQHRFREDINADESLRPHQKASIIDKFNRTKELPR